ncbi:MAG: mandelate racemase/muconate lactonizing enzyme family protein [Pusillimonas sp.]
MKITDVNVFVIGNPWKNWVLVKVVTDEGLCGWGDATTGLSSQPVTAAVTEIRRMCIGKDPRHIEALWEGMYKSLYLPVNSILRSAMAGITTACWDILGQSLGVPLHCLFGGQVQPSIKAYANGWYRGAREPSVFAEAAAAVVAQGYRALKFDPFGSNYHFLSAGERKLSIDIVAAVREAVGDDVDLLIEAHDRFTIPEAIRLAHELEEYKPGWIEAPVLSENAHDLATVAASSPVRIVAGERFTTIRQFADLLGSGRFDVVQPEYVVLGGISRLREVAAIADAYNATIAPHNACCPLSTAINVHVMFSVRNPCIQETFDDFNEPWTKELFTGLPQVHDGYYVAPTGPGLGVTVHEELFERHPYSDHNFLDLFSKGWEQRKSQSRKIS